MYNSQGINEIGLWLCLAVFILGSFIFLFDLGKEAFWDTDEGVYAEVMRETAASGNLLTLKFQDRIWFEKPPLYFWAGINSHKLFSNPEFAYRLPSALAGIFSVVLVMLVIFQAGRNFFASAVAGAILLFYAPFLEAARQVRLDVPVTFALLCAIYFFIKGLKNPRWQLGIGLALGGAILLKSAVGLLGLPVILIYSLFFGNFGWLKNRYFWIGLFSGLIIILPWHFYESRIFGQPFWDEYLFHHVWQRFESDIFNGLSVSVWQHLWFLVQYGLPWSIIFLPSILISAFEKDRKNFSSRFALASGVNAIFIIILFLFAKTRIIYYLVPSYPFIALSLGSTFVVLSPKIRQYNIILGAGVLLAFTGALIHSLMTGYHQYPALRQNSLLLTDEKSIGLYLARNPQPERVYEYGFGFWDSIYYYSGQRNIQLMKEDQVLDHPFYLILPRELYGKKTFEENLMWHFSLIYEGPKLVLLKFDM